MNEPQDTAEQAEALLDVPRLSEALDEQHFRDCLDRLPFPIAFSTVLGPERISYVNPAFERVTGVSASELVG
jgi:PAS domain-containing protein